MPSLHALVKTPEDLDNTQGGGRDRIREITTGRRDTAIPDARDTSAQCRTLFTPATYAPMTETVPERSGLPKQTALPARS